MDASCQRSDGPDIEICLVCGEALAPPVVVCSRCETPHHRECWDYNEGCAVYGCKAGEALEQGPSAVPVPVPAGGVDAEPSLLDALALRLVRGSSDLAFRGTGCIIPVLSFTAYAVMMESLAVFNPSETDLLMVSFGSVVAIVGVIVSAYRRVERLQGFERGRYVSAPASAPQLPALLERGDGGKDLLACLKDLENPGIVAIYGLFLERWERSSVDDATALAVSRALDGHGCPPFALHMLRGRETDEARLERARILAGDPAFLWDAFEIIVGREALWDDEHRGRAVELGQRLADALGDPGLGLAPDATSVMVVSPQRRILGGSGGVRVLTRAAAEGQIEAEATGGRFRWLVGASALGTPHRPQVVVEVRVTNGGCTVRTREERYDIDWNFVTAILPWWLAPPPSRERPAESCLDVFCSVMPYRIRIHEATAELFAYLGRRKSLSHEKNIRQVMVDFMRYAGAARFGHGTLALLGCESRDRSIFADAEAFESYVRWFQATGALQSGLAGRGGPLDRS